MRWRPDGVCPPPDAFAVVMATGIVSIAATDHQYPRISTGLLIIAVGAFAMLTSAAVIGGLDFGDFRTVDVVVRLFTFVAACAVLPARVGWPSGFAWGLAVAAFMSWLPLAGMTARNMWRHRSVLTRQAHGAWELASVATSGLAILAADLSVRWPPLWWVALALWVFALLTYGLMTALILARAVSARFNPAGAGPDSWILMGGLAIATLAGSGVHRYAQAAAGAVLVVSVITCICAAAWIPALVWFSLRRANAQPGALTYTATWWAMVFPLGMFSAATQALAIETGWRGLQTVSLVFFWVAFAAWVTVAVGGLVSLWSHHRVAGVDR